MTEGDKGDISRKWLLDKFTVSVVKVILANSFT